MFIIQFFNVKILSYVLFDIIVHFIIQKLKNKQTFLKNIQTDRTRGEKKPDISQLTCRKKLQILFSKGLLTCKENKLSQTLHQKM